MNLEHSAIGTPHRQDASQWGSVSPASLASRTLVLHCVMLLAATWASSTSTARAERAAHNNSHRICLTVITPLEYPNVPMDPTIDFAMLIQQAELPGVLDPNSIEVWNVATGKRVPHATAEDFAYSDRGRVEFVISDPGHSQYEIRFRTATKRPPLKPQSYTPPIGLGDLLRYNAARPRPVTLAYSMGLHDLNGDGSLDLTGTWNYAYRPGWPWDGIICFPRVGARTRFEVGDLTRLRHVDADGTNDPMSEQSLRPTGLKYFSHPYMAVDFADFDRDGHLDLVTTRRGAGCAEFYLNTGRRGLGGMPIFRSGGSVKVSSWQACRAVDLNGDAAVDLVVDGLYVKNANPSGWPFKAARPVKLDAGRQPCFLDVDQDGRLDAVYLRGGKTVQPDFYRIAWRSNDGGDPPQFGQQRVLDDIDAPLCSLVSAYQDGVESGLIVQHNAFQEISFYRLLKQPDEQHRFEPRGRAESISAVISLSDQAWPCLCDWDDDGDLDLLVGGGYGWPRILINEGTRRRPSFADPQLILAAGEPIRFVRNQILGQPHNWHDMGYSYPDFVDWDGDGLRDLVIPNETNRIFWYKNSGSSKRAKFGRRRQILCDGYPDSPQLRALSAERASDPQSNNGVYPYENERPFLWRTGAGFADFNDDGLMDFVTHDGFTREATLFTQYRHEAGGLRLRKDRVIKLEDGRPINDTIVQRSAHWTESFRAIDWDGDGLQDLIYSVAGSHRGTLDGGSIYLLRNVGTATDPRFAQPQTLRCFGQPIRITNHGPSAWPGDFDGDGNLDLITCVEWSVYPYYSHAALMMLEKPKYEIRLIEPSLDERK